ncbi:uncharacterized protein LOC117533535 [Gymnodraco acuticeps]|uniref:Uncharacterized protein LOC117533535 n=1 Tax=Gymnodraco acuticeps TaxID=8218 RepID=A0A6P8T7J8_GYMAC|nr:uncharacterized protein LOC117533535 [Gymnodraco acuticeps]
MVRFKKGKTKKALDLWQQAGGRDFITRSLISHGFSEVNVTTEQWSSVTLTVFKSNKKEHLKWLRVIWGEDRRGVRTEVLQAALPNPKSPPATKVKKRKVDQQEQDAQGNLTWLWEKKDTEVVVAVLPSQMKGRMLLIRHCELCSLRPHQWLTGEVIEGVFHVAADKFAVLNKMYLLNHYTASVILFGDRTQLISHSLPKVNFDNYEAVLSFVLVNNNHWKLLYIHAKTSTVFLVDPAQSIKELDDSEHAAKRIQSIKMQ